MFKRLPSFSDIVPVYAVIAFMLFAWSILLFFWYLPSWLNFMTFNDLLGVFSYVMASSFIEGLAFLFFLLLLSFIPPQKYFRDEFAVYGTSTALCVIGLIITRLVLFNFWSMSIPQFKTLLFLFPVIFSILAVVLRPVRQALLWLSDRLIVFLYILLPVSILSLLVIVVRNVF
jgi:hypothetical protein